MNLPEAFGGSPVGRLRKDGTIVMLRAHQGTAVMATPQRHVMGGKLEKAGDPMIVQKVDIEPLTKTAREVLNAQVEVVTRETMDVRGNEKGEKRTRTSGGDFSEKP